MANTMFDGDKSKYSSDNPILKLDKDQRAFIEEVSYFANQEYSKRKAAGQDWVLPSVCVSQACLESGYGKYTTVNIFGIKGKGTVAKTAEHNGSGYYSTNASFVSHGTIADDVKMYYDLICGTGNYKGWDRYKNARNNENPADALAEIRKAGYATSPTYIKNTTNILNKYNLSQFDTGMFDIEYSEEGYKKGCETYNKTIEIIYKIYNCIKDGEKAVAAASKGNPQIDYDSIVNFDSMVDITKTMKDLAKKIKQIADNEKYLAEQYSADEGDAAKTFKLGMMAVGMTNFAMGRKDFQAMVGEYTNGNSNEIFPTWFEKYASTEGIESKIVNMSKFTNAIVKTGAATSKNYVVSKASYVFEERQKEKPAKNTNADVASSNPAPSGGTSGGSSRGSAGGGSYKQFKKSTDITPMVTDSKGFIKKPKITKPINKNSKNTLKSDEETTNNTKTTEPITEIPSSQTSGKSETVLNTGTNTEKRLESLNQSERSNQVLRYEKELENQNNTQVPTNSTNSIPPENNNVEVLPQDATNNSEVINDTEGVIVPDDTSSDMSFASEAVGHPVEDIAKVESRTTTTPKTNGIGAAAIGLGLGAAGAAGGAGAFYIHKKHKDNKEENYTEDDELGSEFDDITSENN